MVTVCILATGRYYELALKQAIPLNKSPDYQVIIFSDFTGTPPDGVEVHYMEHRKWPGVTIRKFEMVAQYKHRIKGDYVIIHDADTGFIEIPPTSLFEHDVVALEHIGYKEKIFGNVLPFEMNPKSRAFINKPISRPYRGGSLMGGERERFIDICEYLAKNINDDAKDGIVAVWHDESHWNWFISGNEHTVIPYSEYSKYFTSCDKGGYTHNEARGKSPYQLVK